MEHAAELLPWLATGLIGLLSWEARAMHGRLQQIAVSLQRLEVSWTEKLGQMNARVTSLETVLSHHLEKKE